MTNFGSQDGVEIYQGRMGKLLLFIGAIFLVFFRARWAMRMTGYDESCYFMYVHRLIGAAHPDCYTTTHSPGIALLWLPAALISTPLGWLSGKGLDAWLQPFIGLTSFTVWGLSLLLIDNFLKREKKISLPWYWTVLLLLNVPLLEFAIRYTFLVHAGEFFVALLGVYCLLGKKYKSAIFLIVWLTVIRVNDLPMIFMLIGRYLDDNPLLVRWDYWKENRKKLLPFALVLVPLSILGAIPLYRLAFVTGHNGLFLNDIIRMITGSAFAAVFFSKHWGVMWFTTFWLFVLGSGTFFFRRLSWMGRGALIWMFLDLLFLVGHSALWGSMSHVGLWEGLPMQVRYLIGSYAGAIVVWLELVPQLSEVYLRFSRWLAMLGAMWYTAFIWAGGESFTWYALLTGNGVAYVAYDGSTTNSALRKLLLEPIGLSPMAFSFYSSFPSIALFSKFQIFTKYALVGPELWILNVLWPVVVMGMAFFLYRWKMKKNLIV